MIDDKHLSHLFDLARIAQEEDANKRAKLKHDLEAVLDYFTQLQEVDTDAVEPMTGGTLLSSVVRDDGAVLVEEEEREKSRMIGIEQFPQEQNNHLVVPPIFE